MIKGLTLTQPWATLVTVGAKKIETRSWSTKYRGLVAIHAAKKFPKWARDLCRQQPFSGALFPFNFNDTLNLPHGSIVAVARLVELGMITTRIIRKGRVTLISELPEQEQAFGDYSPARWAWFLENVKPVWPVIPCRGALGLWQVPGEIVEQLAERGLLR